MDDWTSISPSSVTVTRTAAGSYSGGYYSPGATTTLTVTMTVQPLLEKELLLKPEGERTRRWMKAYSPVELFTVDTAAGKRADLVAYDGTTFEVMGVSKYVAEGLSHWKLSLAEVNP